MTNRWGVCLLFLVLGCPAPPRKETQPPPPPPPAGAHVEFEVHGDLPPGGGGGGGGVDEQPSKDQPPHVKLKLGHFKNGRLNIGATIDLISDMTENVADIDPAKLRFDGEDKVWRLEGQYGSNGRIDYVRDGGRVMLQITREGRVTVYVPDPDTDRASDAIDLYRDADADPL